MVVDTSALFAIFTDEPERRRFVQAIEAAEARLLSVATFVEIAIVIDSRYGPEGSRELDRFLEKPGSSSPVDLDQARAARDAFNRYGRGRHRAALNYGDCFSYALAATRGESLLCKGDDLRHTDLALAC